nr:immunoglobulin heavy chain junction region [Macaca mulatta]MOX38721.1 immunoglobulin heavy chain junction region [Macaca mulatta]MOX39050.1 immunoglobulin heavy chain junction region [Macaca mulatta]MOX39081.1 immunoglobulin heavy chain junction region [Macaca mulatta]MOX39127.1 immunoglobulin heavy chain junction region [Macaca mulatta]
CARVSSGWSNRFDVW